MKLLRLGFNPVYSEKNPSIDDISRLEGYTFLEFGAPWCGHCIAAAPFIENVLTGQQLPHIKVFDGKGLPLGRAFKIKIWPTLILLKDGHEVSRVVRPTSNSEIIKLLTLIEI